MTYGLLQDAVATKQRNCQREGCDRFIKEGTYYYATITQTAKSRFTQTFHPECFMIFTMNKHALRMRDSVVKQLETAGTRGPSKKLRSLTSSVEKKRRNTLLQYLQGKDIPDLKNAYKRRLSRNVYMAMFNIHKRLTELAEYGVEETITTLEGDKITAPEWRTRLYKILTHDELMPLMKENDGLWWTQIVAEKIPEVKLDMLRRPHKPVSLADGFATPIWPSKEHSNENEYQEREMHTA